MAPLKGLVLTALISLFSKSALGQFFSLGDDDSGYTFWMPPPSDSLSDACTKTFNSTIACYDILPGIADQGVFPETDDLYALCTTSCLQSLEAFRSSQVSACRDDQLFLNGATYPALYVIDSFIYTYNYTCRTDQLSTSAFCAPSVDAWGNETDPSTSKSSCSDCVLGTLQYQLNSDFGYDNDTASIFRSLTSSCGVTGYPITSPTPYSVTATSPATTTSTAISTSTCSPDYVVKDGQNCEDVSRAMGVSTFDLLTVNGLEGYCASFSSAGSSLCTPHKCTTYTIKENDTCYSISEANAGSPTISQLVSWNPNFNRDCSNIDQAVGFDICVSFPGESSAIDNSQPPSAPAPIPSDVVEGTNTNCSRYYKISNGDYCASVTVQEGISLKDFYFLNPEINSTTCSNLLLGYSYCVAPVGDISLYPGYSPASPNGKDDPCKSADAPDSCFATFPDEDDWEWPTQTGGSPTTSSTSTAAPTVVTLPFASGTLEKCDQYDQYYNSSSKRVNINGCYVVAQVHGITTDQLTRWNPSLTFDSSNPNSCSLQPGFRYCVVNSADSSTPSTSTSPSKPTGTCSGVAPPEQTQDSAPCWCSKWLEQKDGVYCADMASSAGISLADLYTLNPGLNGDCSGLWPGYAYCVGPTPKQTSSTTATATRISTTTSALPASCSGGVAPPEQTQSSAPCWCSRWVEQKDGTYCADMATAAGISLTDLYALNPGLGGDCSGLWPGYAYCVGPVSARATTTSSATAPANTCAGGTAPPEQTQDGISCKCNKWLKQADGVYCADMASKAGISLQRLYDLNPALKGDCSGLWGGYAYCIGLAS